MPLALRAPEAVLESSFDHRIDIWSFGCYLFEVITGEPLFCLPPFYPWETDEEHRQQMHDDNHLIAMTSTLGPLPPAMFERWPRRMRYFDANLNLVRTDVGRSEIPRAGAMLVDPTLEQRLLRSKPSGMTAQESASLVYALRWALQYDPTKRPSATELLSVDWFQRG